MALKKFFIEKSPPSRKHFSTPKANSPSIIVLCFGLILFAVAYSVFKADSVTLKTSAFELRMEVKPK
jgi:hypothetical protein